MVGPPAHAALAADRPVTLVDSSVMLDILTEDSTWAEWSGAALAQARDEGRLMINPIVYAEASVGFDRIEDLDDAVSVGDFEREALPSEAGFLAGKAFLVCRKRGGERRSPLPDFYIGAHAAVRSYRLLTRDTAQVPHLLPVGRAGRPVAPARLIERPRGLGSCSSTDAPRSPNGREPPTGARSARDNVA